MKVVFDYQTFALQKYGGISRYYVSLAKELIKKEVDLKIFSPIYVNKYLDELEEKYISGYGPINIPSKATRLLLKINSIFYNKKLISNKPDVVHQTYFYDNNFTAPTVLTIYDMIHEVFFYEKNNINSKSSIIEQKKRAIIKADKIICISESTKNDLLKYVPISEDKIEVIYLGVENFSKQISEYDNIKFEKPFILFVGKRDGYKNFKLLLESFSTSSKLSKDFNLIAFGGGEFSGAEKKLISDLKIDSNQVINIQGDDIMLNALYTHAKAFIYPSLYEGFGLPPLEAMTKGCPVIVSNSSSIPEVVGNAGVYFDPKSVDSMLGAIESVIYSETRISELVRLGNTRIKEFSWEKCAKKTLETYKSTQR